VSTSREAFNAWLDKPIDWDIAGTPITRRSTMNAIAGMYAEFGFEAGYQASRRAALEAAARECESQRVGFPSYFEIDQRIDECAEAIRGLITKEA
jgi:hypothetical protein